MRSIRVPVVLAAMAVAAAGCGARLNARQTLAANAGRGASSNSATGVAGAAGAGAGSGAGTGTGSAGGSANAAGSSAGAASAGGSAGGAANAAGAVSNPAAAVPAGGNGGGTDVGVTADTISLGNVSTITGPVPGLFKGAVDGTQAFVAYQNSVGGLFGRQLKLKVGDDRLDDGEHRNQVVNLIPQVFGFVGSFSIFDDGGAAEMQQGGVPDVGYALSTQRAAIRDNFSIQPLPLGWRLGPLNYFKTKFGAGVITKVGALYADVPASVSAYTGEKAAMQSVGYQIVYERKFEATETDFTSDIIQMRSHGVKEVVMAADAASMARVASAAAKQNYTFTLPNYGANAYDPNFIAQAGSASEGALIDQQLAMYGGEDAGSVPEVQLFNQWFHRVNPGGTPDLFAAFGWASGRLFAQAYTAAGAKAKRADLLAALGKVDNFDDNGLLAPAGPASKRPPVCWMLVKIQGGKFVRADPPGSGFRCNDGGYFYLKQ